MLKRLLSLFGKRTVVVPGADKLVEGEGRTVEIGDLGSGGRQVLLCRVEGKVHGLDTQCPHEKGGRIVRGPLVDGRYAMCPLHGYQFDATTGKPREVVCRDAKRIACVEKDGSIEIKI